MHHRRTLNSRTLGFMKICSYHFKWQMWDGSVSTHTCLLFVATEIFKAWKGIAPNVFATVLISMPPANFRSQTLVWFLDETTYDGYLMGPKQSLFKVLKLNKKNLKIFLKIWWLATIALLVLKLNKKNLKMFLEIQWLATIALLVLDVFYIWFITDPKFIYALPSTLQCFQ